MVLLMRVDPDLADYLQSFDSTPLGEYWQDTRRAGAAVRLDVAPYAEWFWRERAHTFGNYNMNWTQRPMTLKYEEYFAGAWDAAVRIDGTGIVVHPIPMRFVIFVEADRDISNA